MLATETCCDIGDLIQEIVDQTAKSWDEVESALMECHLYPDSTKTYVTDQFGGYDTGIGWLDEALDYILSECGHKSIYITTEI